MQFQIFDNILTREFRLMPCVSCIFPEIVTYCTFFFVKVKILDNTQLIIRFDNSEHKQKSRLITKRIGIHIN